MTHKLHDYYEMKSIYGHKEELAEYVKNHIIEKGYGSFRFVANTGKKDVHGKPIYAADVIRVVGAKKLFSVVEDKGVIMVYDNENWRDYSFTLDEFFEIHNGQIENIGDELG